MRPRHGFLVTVPLAVALLGSCTSDGAPAATDLVAATNVAAVPTPCVADDGSETPTVTIDVDDDSDGFGRFGLKTPSPLSAGTVRLAVNSVSANKEPIDVTVTSAGGTVFEFVRVGSGIVCAVALNLEAGDYTVMFGAKSKTFTVVPVS